MFLSSFILHVNIVHIFPWMFLDTASFFVKWEVLGGWMVYHRGILYHIYCEYKIYMLWPLFQGINLHGFSQSYFGEIFYNHILILSVIAFRSCNQKLGSRAFRPTKRSGPRLLSTVPWTIYRI